MSLFSHKWKLRHYKGYDTFMIYRNTLVLKGGSRFDKKRDYIIHCRTVNLTSLKSTLNDFVQVKCDSIDDFSRNRVRSPIILMSQFVITSFIQTFMLKIYLEMVPEMEVRSDL